MYQKSKRSPPPPLTLPTIKNSFVGPVCTVVSIGILFHLRFHDFSWV